MATVTKLAWWITMPRPASLLRRMTLAAAIGPFACSSPSPSSSFSAVGGDAGSSSSLEGGSAGTGARAGAAAHAGANARAGASANFADAGESGTIGTGGDGSTGTGGSTLAGAGRSGAAGAGGTAPGGAGRSGTAGAGGTATGGAGRSGTGGAGGSATGGAGRSGTAGGNNTPQGGTTGGAGASGVSGAHSAGSVGAAGANSAGAGGAPPLAVGPLRVDAKNHRYFSDGSKVVFLTGSHTWQTFKDRSLTDPPTPFDYSGFLDFLVARNHNFFRLWTWEQPKSWNNNTDNLARFFSPFPWPRTGPALANDGKPAFDLSKFEQTYFDRMRTRIVDAGKRGIYVSVMLFDGWDLVHAYDPLKGGFPYGAGNNVNGIASGGTESQHLTIDAVTKVQEAYVKKVIDTVGDLDNVLYEIANETDSGGIPWQYHMIDYIKSYEAAKPKQHPVGMTCTFPGTDADLMRSNADWISPCSSLFPADGTKVVLNDTDHSYYWSFLKQAGLGPQQIWVWQNLMIGASAMFMDPYLETWGGRNAPVGTTLDPYWDVIRNAMRYAHTYAQKMNLELAVPSGDLSSTGYCLANPGTQYLAYQSLQGPFALTVLAGTYQYEWFNPSTGTVVSSGSIQLPAGPHTFSPGFSGDAVLYLTR